MKGGEQSRAGRPRYDQSWEQKTAVEGKRTHEIKEKLRAAGKGIGDNRVIFSREEGAVSSSCMKREKKERFSLENKRGDLGLKEHAHFKHPGVGVR